MCEVVDIVNVDEEEIERAEECRLQQAQRLLYRLALGEEDVGTLRLLSAQYLAETMTPADVRAVFGGGRRGARNRLGMFAQ